MSARFLLKTIMPIAAVASGSLICSNAAYLYLSVPFIQMLKALSPVFVLFLTWLWSLKKVSTSDIVSILVITCGVMLASIGELDFSWLGTAIHLGGLGCEALRVVMIQALLTNEGHSIGPLMSLYYYAPACALFNFLLATVTELPKITLADIGKVGWPLLLLNGAIAFLVNISSITLVSWSIAPISEGGRTADISLDWEDICAIAQLDGNREEHPVDWPFRRDLGNGNLQPSNFCLFHHTHRPYLVF
jgi:drug/metabolite transporter (DMT)-like permease